MITYRVAGPEDHADIETLLAETDMPGWVTLSYRGTPGLALMPGMAQSSVIGRDRDGTLAGMSTRTVLPGFWRGERRRIGWVGQLRLAQRYRHRPRVLAGGFDAFRKDLHRPAETPWYMASILEDNGRAQRLLERGVPGFPRFQRLMQYHSLVYRPQRSIARGLTLARIAKPQDLPSVIAYLNEENAQRPLGLAFDAGEAFTQWPGLSPKDLLILEDEGQIQGVTALWDQRPHRALVVTDYDRRLRALRPLMNVAGPLTRSPHLPPVGESLAMGYLSLFTVRGNAPQVARALIQSAQVLARKKRLRAVSLGLVEDDPLLPAAKSLWHRVYDSRLYGVTLEGEMLPDASAFARAKIDIALL